MEERQIKQQKVFENLSKKERKMLRKEFNKDVESRYKFYLWIGIVILLAALISGGFSIYFMLNIFSSGVITYQLYICAIIFTIGCVISLFFTSQYHKRFQTWLRECKDIYKK